MPATITTPVPSPTTTMPTEGQFVAVWSNYLGTWSQTLKWIDGELHQYMAEGEHEDQFIPRPRFFGNTTGMKDLQFIVL